MRLKKAEPQLIVQQVHLVVNTVHGTYTYGRQMCLKGPGDVKITKKKVLDFQDV